MGNGNTNIMQKLIAGTFVQGGSSVKTLNAIATKLNRGFSLKNKQTKNLLIL